ncbi:fungal-specific transcription factor domain-containing protein [Aspergillus bertholletiae]|uniref:Fungal-specific transcription factor domain-containing protein n=1 Tax=Aspergillus bertholletiae TaxID=1226010 RepID=A0A5N7BPG0_9EURO|nr:fungal-specific transcription factor domain-containing protein [Aspergillus bertholletiae]
MPVLRMCRRCHARKVKCTGGMPCKNCRQTDSVQECHYPSRVRRIRVEQRYIDGLLDEIHRLQQAVRTVPATGSNSASLDVGTETRCAGRDGDAAAESLQATSSSPTGTKTAPAVSSSTEAPDGVRNPLLDDRPWFFTLTPDMPVLVGEASDAGFATRLRQELLGKSQGHFLRTQNVRDEALCSFWASENAWPAPSRARFLLKVAFRTACRRYYLTRKSATLQLLEQAITDPSTCDLISSCKLHALFALGEAYSTRSSQPDNTFPGMVYYANATRMLRLLSEQPRTDCIEIMIILSIYALAMNRRHSAYCMVGSAVRFAVITGLHLNVPQDQLPDRQLREHRNRVWWTAYILDRSWAFMLGRPVSIQDEDIDVDLPSHVESSSPSVAEDFVDTDYLTASIHVARIGAHIAASIYGRRPQLSTFSQRVQQAIRDLDGWLQELPAPLRAAISQVPPNAPMPIVTLYLYFNQCLILATRPVLLHVLHLRRARHERNTADQSLPFIETASALSEACLQCARRSYHILTESWVDGSFPTFDYTYTQYLFSTSLILAISSLLQNPNSSADRDDFETAVQILKQLDHNGNYAAKEFCRHVESIKAILESGRCTACQPGCSQCPHPPHTTSNAMLPSAQEAGTLAESADAARFGLSEPSLEGLLAQSNLDLGLLDPSVINDGFQAFMWREGDFGGWVGSYDTDTS